jgi:shikimate kinase
MNVMLIGARASGKSTLARVVANALWRKAVDMDDLVLAQFAEPTISEVWRVHGEPAWREAEATATAELLRADDQIIAAGGGAPLIPAVQEVIAQARAIGQLRVIYLACDAAELRRRLEAEPGDRPPLIGRDPAEELEVVLAQRDPVYRMIADVILDVSHLGERDAADYLLRNHF